LLAGHRDLKSVVGLYDAHSGAFAEIWADDEITSGGRYISVSGIGEQGDFALVGEGFARSPEIAVVRHGHYRRIKSFDLGYIAESKAIAAVERVTWQAPDSLGIQGWLLRPQGNGPHPLITNIHGGPAWHWRPTWLGRAGAPIVMLLRRGYAVFYPNPRGSTGRGRDFASQVLGDMGGADVSDFLSGIDHLVDRQIADATRLGVMGASYGGFMASWLICHDTRFSAAVSVAPMINYVTQYLVSNVPQFASLYLQDTYYRPGGKYFERSPVMHAHKARTPIMSICGALDLTTPAIEAAQFHHALQENGVTSVLVTYPEEGHGVRKFPTLIDYAARVVAWFEEQT
jgi:dipeptidyl aminopeptidase/acylaminoacyl peptidase